MNSLNSSESNSPALAPRDPSPQSIAWCFVPINPDQIGHCSRGFCDFFEVGDHFIFDSTDLGASLESVFRTRGLPVEILRKVDSAQQSDGKIGAADGISITSETTFDDSGIPTGRMLIFERTVGPNLPNETVERLQDATRRLAILSPRESEILNLVYDGYTNKAIGIRSEISEKTVEKHRSNIMHKLGLQNSSLLIRCVSEARLGAELLHNSTDDEA